MDANTRGEDIQPVHSDNQLVYSGLLPPDTETLDPDQNSQEDVIQPQTVLIFEGTSDDYRLVGQLQMFRSEETGGRESSGGEGGYESTAIVDNGSSDTQIRSVCDNIHAGVGDDTNDSEIRITDSQYTQIYGVDGSYITEITDNNSGRVLMNAKSLATQQSTDIMTTDNTMQSVHCDISQEQNDAAEQAQTVLITDNGNILFSSEDASMTTTTNSPALVEQLSYKSTDILPVDPPSLSQESPLLHYVIVGTDDAEHSSVDSNHIFSSVSMGTVPEPEVTMAMAESSQTDSVLFADEPLNVTGHLSPAITLSCSGSDRQQQMILPVLDNNAEQTLNSDDFAQNVADSAQKVQYVMISSAQLTNPDVVEENTETQITLPTNPTITKHKPNQSESRKSCVSQSKGPKELGESFRVVSHRLEFPDSPVFFHLVKDSKESDPPPGEQGNLQDVCVTPDGNSPPPSQGTGQLIKERAVYDPTTRRFQCNLCSATFTRYTNLTRHRITHTVETPAVTQCRYTCKMCERQFLQQCDKVRHMKTHFGNEPHKCDTCGKRYVRKSDLVVHKRFHSNERNFQCQHCSRAFYQSGDLNRHVRNVHEHARMLVCGHCDKKYANEATLMRHVQNAHKDLVLRNIDPELLYIDP